MNGTKEKQRSNNTSNDTVKQLSPYERLTDEERDQFTASYYRGHIMYRLFLKASGLVDPVILSQAPEDETAAGWFVNKSVIDGEIANLMYGLENLTGAMDWIVRQEKQVPTLLELLQKSNYLTQASVEWIQQELKPQGLPVGQMLTRNFLLSDETLAKTVLILNTLDSILSKTLPA